jgi:hypothetical protein
MISIGPDVAAAAAWCGTSATLAVAPNSATMTANHTAALTMAIWRIVRPLQPPLARTLALIEHRNKPNAPALEIVRNALLTLRTDGPVEPSTT